MPGVLASIPDDATCSFKHVETCWIHQLPRHGAEGWWLRLGWVPHYHHMEFMKGSSHARPIYKNWNNHQFPPIFWSLDNRIGGTCSMCVMHNKSVSKALKLTGTGGMAMFISIWHKTILTMMQSQSIFPKIYISLSSLPPSVGQSVVLSCPVSSTLCCQASLSALQLLPSPFLLHHNNSAINDCTYLWNLKNRTYQAYISRKQAQIIFKLLWHHSHTPQILRIQGTKCATMLLQCLSCFYQFSTSHILWDPNHCVQAHTCTYFVQTMRIDGTCRVHFFLDTLHKCCAYKAQNAQLYYCNAYIASTNFQPLTSATKIKLSNVWQRPRSWSHESKL